METFGVEVKKINGKKIMIIKTKSEEITHPDGTKDVVIHAPALNLINNFINEQREGQ